MLRILREKEVRCLYTAIAVLLLVIGHQITNDHWTKRQEINNVEETIVQNRLAEAEFAWEKGKEKRKGAMTEFAVLQKNPSGQVKYRSFWDFFYPSFECPHSVERIGRLGDGGKWVCGFNLLRQKKKPCLVYSFGISNETTFEEEILRETNCTVYMYDFDLLESPAELLKLYPQRALFYKLGLGTSKNDKFTTLKNEMDRKSHDFVDILKIDIEGDEFDTLRQFNASFPNGFPFAQLLIEVHLGFLKHNSQIGLIGEFNEWWEMLDGAGLRPFRNEVNFFVPFLRAFEFSFINVAVDNILLHASKKSTQ